VIPADIPKTPLLLLEHLAVKLSLNTISTGTMARMGRLSSNWMSHVEMTNKKLVDRNIRLICELCGMSYEDACFAVFEAKETLAETGAGMSPVQHVIRNMRASE
jgi:N-acetylmuramic acid 6-phosphate etherase